MDKTARKTRAHKQVGMTPIREVWLFVIVGLLVCPAVKGDNRNIQYNHKLKVLDTQRQVVTSLAGTGRPGKSVGSALVSALNEPGGLAVYGKKILISDTNNHRILQFDRNAGRLTEWRLRP